MILRQIHLQPLKAGRLLSSKNLNSIPQNSVRKKSIIQWYNHLWSKFDDPIVKPPYKHCTQVGKQHDPHCVESLSLIEL